jgi:hypothetical protein
MNNETLASTRRNFLKFGAMAAAPFVAATPAAAARLGDDSAAKLARLEAMNAMRDVHGAFVRAVNARRPADAAALFADPKAASLDSTLTGLAADPAAAETWDIAADGRSATLRTAMTVKTETPLLPCPLVEMAKLQGEGVCRQTASRTLETAFVKTEDGAWKIERAALAEA